MNNEEMSQKKIQELLKASGTPCVSIVFPTHRLSPERMMDQQNLEKAVNKAKALLEENFSEIDYAPLTNKLDHIMQITDFNNSYDGIGIYASNDTSGVVKFPFTVVEKVKVSDSFDSRDLLYYLGNVIDYGVLSIGKKVIHLYAGKGEEFAEVINEDFPVKYEETYEYERPVMGTSFSNSSLKGFEKDKSVLEAVRLKDFLKTADQRIRKYVNHQIPILVSGGKKEIGYYLEISQNEDRIIGTLPGNYNFNGAIELARLSRKGVQDYVQNQNKILLSNIRELFGEGLVAVGFEDVWTSANEGKGQQLVIEKDFECRGYLETDGFDFRLTKPVGKKNFKYIDDAADRIIKTVLDKNGKVAFVDNGQLEDFYGIVLKLRYNNNQT